MAGNGRMQIGAIAREKAFSHESIGRSLPSHSSPAARKAIYRLLKGGEIGLPTLNILFSMAASFLILVAMGKINPVSAAVIEASYPFFIVLAAFAFFGSAWLNVGNLVGGLLVLTGVGVAVKWG